MKKPTQAAPKKLNFDEMSNEEKLAYENAKQDCYGQEYKDLKFKLMFRHYHGKDDDVIILLNYDNSFLEGFRKYIIDIDNKSTEEHDDDYLFLMPGRNDQKPTFYRGDLVNKIDMIIHLRKSVSPSTLNSLANYIKPYFLDDLFNIIKAYVEAWGDYDWVTKDDILKFIKKYNGDLLCVLKAFAELKLQTILNKYGDKYASEGYIRNNYSVEDQQAHYYTTRSLELIEEVSKGKSRFRFPFNK